MKKTLNINIGNSIIHIEEDAYELLTNYLIEVKQHFGKSADDFEIVNDIENRIAEMFLEMLRTQEKQVIEPEDVQIVIAMMGSVKDFEEEPEDNSDEAEYRAAYAAGFERKIFRDTDGGMVAGVCSGLSYYLKIDVSILRVIAVLTVLLGGSGFLAYLILWIAIPKADSRSEKMAMKGEAVNLQGFKRNFEEELSSLHKNLKNAGDHLHKRSGTFVTEFVEVLGNFMKGTGRSIFKFIAVIIVIIGSFALLAAFIAIAAALGFYDSSISQIFPLNIVDVSYFTTFLIASFIVFIIPLLALILFSVRIAFNTAPVNKTISYALLLIWLAGLSAAIFYVAKTTSEFKEEAEFTQTVPVKKYPVYTLTLDKSRLFSKEDSLRYQLNSADNAGLVIQENHHFGLPKNLTIRIERSESDEASVHKSYRSNGVNFETALYQAKNIQYTFVQQDSVLKFSPKLHLKRNANWRDQRVEIVFRIPAGTRLNIDRDLDRYIQNYSLWSCDSDDNEDHSDQPYKGVMTSEGLKCRE